MDTPPPPPPPPPDSSPPPDPVDDPITDDGPTSGPEFDSADSHEQRTSWDQMSERPVDDPVDVPIVDDGSEVPPESGPTETVEVPTASETDSVPSTSDAVDEPVVDDGSNAPLETAATAAPDHVEDGSQVPESDESAAESQSVVADSTVATGSVAEDPPAVESGDGGDSYPAGDAGAISATEVEDASAIENRTDVESGAENLGEEVTASEDATSDTSDAADHRGGGLTSNDADSGESDQLGATDGEDGQAAQDAEPAADRSSQDDIRTASEEETDASTAPSPGASDADSGRETAASGDLSTAGQYRAESGDDVDRPDESGSPMDRWEAAEDRILSENADYFDSEAQRYREQGNEEAATAPQEAADRARFFVGDVREPDRPSADEPDTVELSSPKLERVWGSGFSTPGGRAYYDPGDSAMRASAASLGRFEGEYTVDAHGDPAAMYCSADALSGAEVAELIRADPSWNQQPVRLFSCETGKGDYPIAQTISDALQVPVTAPTELAWCDDNGNSLVAPKVWKEVGGSWFEVAGLEPPGGGWRTFFPSWEQQNHG